MRPVHPPPAALLTEELTAPADRPAPAAFAFSIRVAAGYLRRRLNAGSFTGRCNGPGSPAPESRRAILSRCLKCALRRTMRVLPAQRPGRVLVPWVLRGRVTPGPHDEVQVVLKEPHPRAA